MLGPSISVVRSTAIEYDGSSLWVAEIAKNRLTRIDPASLQVVGHLEVSGEPTAMHADGADIWVATRNNTFGTNIAKVGSFMLPTQTYWSYVGRDSIESSSEGVWVSDSAKDRLYLVDRDLGQELRTFTLGLENAGPIEVVAGQVWVWGSAPNTPLGLYKFSSTAGELIWRSTSGKWSNPVAMEYDGINVWFASSFNEGLLRQFDPDTGDIVSTIEVGADISEMLIIGDVVWVATGSSLIEVDRVTGTVIRNLYVGENVTSMTTDGSNLFALLGGSLVARMNTEV